MSLVELSKEEKELIESLRKEKKAEEQKQFLFEEGKKMIAEGVAKILQSGGQIVLQGGGYVDIDTSVIDIVNIKGKRILKITHDATPKNDFFNL